MAELYHSHVPTSADRPARDHLVGLSRLTVAQQFKLYADQVEMGITRLLPAHPLLQQLTGIAGTPPVPAADRDAFTQRIADLHEDLLVRLCAVDASLGKAYGLGRSLAETVLLPWLAGKRDHSAPPAAGDGQPPDPDAVYKTQFGTHRLENLYGWLADLKSLLPDHSAYAVSWSLQQWAQWVKETASPTAEPSAGAALRRQGEQWRALLSGERLAKDLLTALDYVDAAKGLSAGLGRAIGAFVVRYKGTVVITVVALLAVVGGVVAAAVATGNASVLLAGITALFGAVGGWRGVNSTLGKGLRTLEPYLWASELDRAIADRIVLLPDTATQAAQPEQSIGLLVADRSYHRKNWQKPPPAGTAQPSRPLPPTDPSEIGDVRAPAET
jgi:hypothetical protein